jgi:NitT/TauT family transport system permease protein
MSATTTSTPATAPSTMPVIPPVRPEAGQEFLARNTSTTKRGSRLTNIVGPTAVFGMVLGVWYYMSLSGLPKHKRFLMPQPHKIIESFVTDDLKGSRAKILTSTFLSAQVAVYGLVIAIAIGLAVAVLMSQKKWVEKSLWPYVIAMQAIPILTITPLIGGLVGFSFRARLLVTVIIALFPIISNTLFGLLSVDQSLHDLFKLHGASRLTRLVRLQLPAAMPSIFAGFRISAGLAVIGSIVGDTFFRQGKPGLGSQVDVYRNYLQGPQMWTCIILAALLGLLFFWVFGLLNQKAVGHWHESTRA